MTQLRLRTMLAYMDHKRIEGVSIPLWNSLVALHMAAPAVRSCQNIETFGKLRTWLLLRELTKPYILFGTGSFFPSVETRPGHECRCPTS